MSLLNFEKDKEKVKGIIQEQIENGEKSTEKFLEENTDNLGIFKIPESVENMTPFGLSKQKQFDMHGKLDCNKMFEIVFLFDTREERDRILALLNIDSKIIEGKNLHLVLREELRKMLRGDANAGIGTA